jgi:hypothetical protein
LLGSNNNNPLPQLPNKYTTTTAHFLNFQISNIHTGCEIVAMVVLMCSVVQCHLPEAKESGSQSSGEQIQVKVERPEE